MGAAGPLSRALVVGMLAMGLLAGVLPADAKEDISADEESGPETASPPGVCAAAYHDALSGIAETDLPALKRSVKSVNTGWRKLSGNWVFPPIRLRKDKSYRTLVYRASRLIRTRGIDLRLRAHLRNQLVTRVATDLKVYATQRPAAALCTGAQGYMDILQERLAPLRKRAVQTATYFERAAQIADWKLAEADIALVRNVKSSANTDGNDVRARLDRMTAEARAARRLWSVIVDADAAPGRLVGHFETLRAMRDRLKPAKPRRRSALTVHWQALRIALSGLESLAYIQASHAKTHEVEGAFLEAISAVRAAHRTNCSCTN
ncbi:MAG: hypothetical protein ACR2PM_06815 [Hyphomicrobiales bacterium]